MILGALGLVAQVSIAVLAPDTVVLRQPAAVTVRAVASGRNPPHIEAPHITGASLVRTTTAARMDRSGDEVSAVVEEHYLLTALRPGVLELPAFTARLDWHAMTAPTKQIVVRPVTESVPAIVSRAKLDPRAGIEFHAMVARDTVYVGEQTTYEVGVFLGDDVRRRLRRSPEFVPPELRSMMAYEVATPGALVARRQVGPQRFEVHVFQRALFPLAPGAVVIPAAELNYSLPLSASFFSREESYSLRSDSVVVVAVEPPTAGRPADWHGAVGQLGAELHLETHRGRVGDPTILTLLVRGVGNVNLFPRPALEIPWAQTVTAGERVQVDSAAPIVRGVKEFDWVVTPRHAGSLTVPSVRYPYFDPDARRYDVAATRPETLLVENGSIASTESASGDTTAALALRGRYRGAVGEPVTSHPSFWLVMALAPIPAAAAGIVRRPRRRRPLTAAQRLRRLERDSARLDSPAIRRAFVAALRERVGLSSAALTNGGELVRALRREGVSLEGARRAEASLAELDAAVYGQGRETAPASGLASRAVAAFETVDDEARIRRVPPVATIAIVGALALSLGASVRAATLPSGADDLFTSGTQAYAERHYGASERAFAELTELAPRAPDAWANLGTAAWAAHDTATAAVGWQRTLRLEPLAADVRDRLDLVAGAHGRIDAIVPWVPLSAAAVVAGVCWILACAGAAGAIWRRSRDAWRWSTAAAACAVACAMVAAWAHSAREARHLAVVLHGDHVRVLPALGAEEGPQLGTGEVARVDREEAAWSHVILDGGRAGWIETAHLRSIALD